MRRTPTPPRSASGVDSLDAQWEVGKHFTYYCYESHIYICSINIIAESTAASTRIVLWHFYPIVLWHAYSFANSAVGAAKL